MPLTRRAGNGIIPKACLCEVRLGGRLTLSEALTTVGAAGRVGQRVRVAGMRQTWRRSRTAQGGCIYFMALEDLEGMLDVVVLGEVYQRSRSGLSQLGPHVLEGTVELGARRGQPVIRAERIWPLAPQVAQA